MSLNYELEAVAEWQAIPSGTVQTVCFATMFAGCPIITETGKDGWQAVAARVRMWETVCGPIRADGEFCGPDLIRRFVGLRTNASRMTDAQFRKHVAQALERRSREAVAKEIAAMETATEAGE